MANTTVQRFVVAFCFAAVLRTSFAAEQKLASPVVTKDTQAHSTPIKLDITGAKVLYLEVTDGGDGTSYDWADWMEPRLIGPKGELKLTDLKWRKLNGRAVVGKNQNGGSLKVNGNPVPFGIGTHARSTIVYGA